MLVDAESDPTAVALEYAAGTAGAVTAAAGPGAGSRVFTRASLLRVERSGQVIPGFAPAKRTPLLETSPNGLTYDLVWDWTRDLGHGARPGVSLRVVPVDDQGREVGTPAEAEGVKVGNDPPVLGNVTIEGRSGNVVVRFDLSDSTDDICSVRARYWLPGVGYRPLVHVVGGQIDELVAHPGAHRFDFTWDTVAELGAVSAQVRLELTPGDEKLAWGPTTTSATVLIDNNAPPSVQVTPPIRFLTATVSTSVVTYTLTDPEGDPADVSVWYETEDGTASGSASLLPGGEVTTARPSSPGGTAHTFAWSYVADLGDNAAHRVRLRFTAADATGDSTPSVTTGVFVVGNDPPTLTLSALPNPATGNVSVDYQLFDSSADLASITVEYSTDGVTYQPASSGSAKAGLTTTAPGNAAAPAPHTFVWQSAVDLPALDGGPVWLCLQVDDGLVGGTGSIVISTTVVDNVGNRPPQAVVTTRGRTVSGTVGIAYTVKDLDSSPVSTVVEYSTDGVAYHPASPAAGSPGTSNLATTPTGLAYTFVWDYGANLGLTASSVFVRVTPSDVDGAGAPGTTARFTVGNDAPTAAITQTPSGEQAGTVAIQYTLFDSSQDLASLTPEFSADGGATWHAATTQVSQATGLLTADPSNSAQPFTHTFVWNSEVDAASTDFQGPVTLSLEPTDGFAVGTASTTLIALDNNEPPRVEIDTPPRSVSGTVAIAYRLFDPEGDNANVVVTFEREDRTASGTAAVAGGDGTSGLGAVAGGSPHSFVWNAEQDLGGKQAARVRVRVQARDAAGDAGPAASSAVFVFGNDAPVATVTVPSQSTGNVPIDYTLFDTLDDLASVEVEFSTDGSNFTPAAGTSGTSALTTTAPGDPSQPALHTFVWDSEANLPNVNGEVVTLRIRANDGLDGGLGSFVTATTSLDNVGNRRPLASMAAIGRTTGFTVTIPVIVRDPDSHPVDLAVFFRVGAGAFQPASGLQAPGGVSGNVVLGLASSPGGTAHTITWDAAADLLNQATPGVQLRLVPSDADEGPEVISNAFAVGNDAPVVTIDPISGQKTGLVQVNFRIFDSTEDPARITVRFKRLDTGAESNATITLGSLRSLLTTFSGTGAAHAVIWDSAADLPATADPIDVTIEIVAEDDLAGGLSGNPIESATFSVFNPGELVVEKGPVDLGSVGVAADDSGVRVLQLRLTENTNRLDMTVNQISFQPTGDIDEQAAVNRAVLIEDANANGQADAGEREIAELLSPFGSDDAPLTFDLSPSEVIERGTTEHWLLLLDLSGAGALGRDLQVEVDPIPAVLVSAGVVSGGLVTSETKTISGVLMLSPGPFNPSSGTIFPSDTDVPILQLRHTTRPTEDIDISEIRFLADGTGDAQASVAAVRLYEDVNGNGALDVGIDRQIGTVQTIAAGTQEIVFDSIDERVPANGTVDWLLAYDFTAAPLFGDTFRVTLSGPESLTARGVDSAAAIVARDLPVAGATLGIMGWAERSPTTSPPARIAHSMAYDSHRQVTVLFGGSPGGNDTWEWDGDTWTLRSPATSPQLRNQPGMAYDSNRRVVVLFGGNAFIGGSFAPNNDTWEWDGANWTLRDPVNRPPPVDRAALAYDSARQVTVFVKQTGAAETWEWDGTNWTQRTPTTSPQFGSTNSLAYDSVRGVVVLFGGAGQGDDTWEWDGIDWVQRTPSAKPPGRDQASMCFDSARGVCVLFGGNLTPNSGSEADDTWEWDGVTWTEVLPAFRPTKRTLTAMVYQEHRGAVLLFSGGGALVVGNDTLEYFGP